MKKILRLLACLFLCPLVMAQTPDAGEYPLRVEQSKIPSGVRLSVVNDGPATMTVFFRLDGDNAQTDRDTPLTVVVAPHSSRDLVQVSPRRRLDRFRFDYSHSSIAGDAFAPPDKNHHYRLPFQKGVKARIGQEPGGVLITHNGPHNRHAVDFGVPEGTLVTAARAGTVIEVKDGFTEGRFDPALDDRANRVVVIHADRSVGHYLHLAPRRVLVRPGQQVRVGEALAYSGNTGYSSGPHLHFDVRRAVAEPGTVMHQSVPVDFYDAAGKKIVLKAGEWIEAD
ncbi:MAG: M23 family metallopeptidase [Azoarcus sp.]|nr:M23 family metallopeptidase [Azoarcus sp.]